MTTTPGDVPVPPPNPLLLSSYDQTKDIRQHPVFHGRHVWPRMWEWYVLRFTPGGRWFFLLTIVFVIYGSSSLDLQVFVPFTYAFGFWVVANGLLFFMRPCVTLKILHGARVGAGGTIPVTLDLRQTGARPGINLVVIPHRLPLEIDAVPSSGVAVPMLKPGERETVRMGLNCKRRGVYSLAGFRVQTDFPLGLLRAYTTIKDDHSVLVYPEFTALSRLEIPQGRRYQPGGVALASNLGESLEFIGNRDFREGDNIRDINWRASARLDRPVVREYREEYFHRVGVILDTFVPKKDESARREDFERAVSLSAAVSDYMSRQEYVVDLFAAGPDLYHLSAGRSLAYLDQILDILACLEPGPREPFSILEPELLESLAQITTVICVLLDWDETRRAFATRVRQASGVKVIIVRDAPCTLDPMRDADWAGTITLVTAAQFRAGVAGFMTPIPVFRLPWSAFCAVLVAFTALAFTSASVPGYAFLGGCALLVAVTYVLPPRLPDTTVPVAHWGVRLVVYGAIMFLSGGIADPSVFFGDPQHGAVIFGCLSASEVVVQCWRERPAGKPLGVALVYFTGVVFVTACYSFSIDVFRIAAPVYFLFMALSLTAFSDAPTQMKQERFGILAARASAVLLSLLVGGLCYAAFYLHRADLTTWGQNILQGRVTPESAGVSDDPVLGTTFGLQGSARRVLFVTGETGPIYLRGPAFDTYARGRWGPSVDQRHSDTVTPQMVGAFARGKGVRVTRLADADGVLFAPLDSAGIRPLQQDDLEWSQATSGPLRTRTASPSDYEYVRPANVSEIGLWAAPLTETDRARLLVLPSDLDPGIRALATQIVDIKASPEQKIAAVQRYLPANHAYSLTFTAGPGDPLASFLLSKSAAHCEYFASGTVILLRCLGVPARYVTGYYAHEGEGAGVAVRQRDAHAWAEAWVGGTGWVTVDSTPGGGRPDALFGNAPVWQHGAEEFEDAIRNIRDWVSRRKPVQVWTTLGIIAAVYLAITGWRETRLNQRKRIPAFTYTSPEALSELAVRFEAVLRREGIPSPPGLPWDEHLRQVAHGLGEDPRPSLDLETATAFIHAYNSARFGDATASLDELNAQLTELEQTKTPALR